MDVVLVFERIHGAVIRRLASVVPAAEEGPSIPFNREIAKAGGAAARFDHLRVVLTCLFSRNDDEKVTRNSIDRLLAGEVMPNLRALVFKPVGLR